MTGGWAPEDERRRVELRVSDVVVVGSGVAGLSVALRLASGHGGRPLDVTVLSKTGFGDGASRWAQGGIACALGSGDSPARHATDTLAVSGGLGHPEVVSILTREAPERIVRLIERGARFDRAEDGRLALGLEGGHTQKRILHAGGDATGAEVMRALTTAARTCGDLRIEDGTRALELTSHGGRVTGLIAEGPTGRRVEYRAAAVILASGGFGGAYLKTTNPAVATGDAIAMAARAGALLADMEFVQFHPTALDVGVEPMPLLTEALRGAGATLVDGKGRRFMPGISPMAELAPRDLVARAIWEMLEAGERVLLDARGALRRREFPTAVAACRRHGLDLAREPVPVGPAAHYTMGGVAVDEHGRASLAGLWVCGEAASSGLHGANRLASNSLLEGLVFGARVADDVAGRIDVGPTSIVPAANRGEPRLGSVAGPLADDGTLELETRKLLWTHVGVVRTEHGLQTALRELTGIARSGRVGSRARDLATVGLLSATAALARRESRGAHFRRDFPSLEPAWKRRLFLRTDLSGLEPRMVEGLEERFAREHEQEPALISMGASRSEGVPR